MQTLTHLDLFSGIGGFALAAQANNVETKIFCEKNESCCDFLTRTYGLPIVRDVRNFDGTRWRGVWLLTAGVPCQPASRAGKQGGETDDRWLWPEALRITEESQPTWALFENPPGILDVGLDGILSELGRIGYESQSVSIPACAVNSPQDRERIWIIAHRNVAHSRHDAICAKFGESLQERDPGIGKSNQGAVGDSKSGNGRLLLQPRRQVETCFEFAGSVESGVVANGNEPGQKRSDVREVRVNRAANGLSPERPQSIMGNTESPRRRTSRKNQNKTEPTNALASPTPCFPMANTAQQHRAFDGQKASVIGRGAKTILADSNEQSASKPNEKDSSISRQDAWLGSVRSAWSDYQWLACENGKIRRFPNSLHRLGDGVSSRILEALGNAIVWPVASEIIAAMIATEATNFMKSPT